MTVSDGDLGSAADSLLVSVTNAGPTVTLTGQTTVAEGSTYTYSYTTTDDGTETFARDAQDCDGGTLGRDTSTRSTAAAASIAATPTARARTTRA